jgi:dihydroorotate dehydrogenase (NAD+) catalytic subunit
MDLSVKIGSYYFNNPLLTASGTFSEKNLEFYGSIPFGGIVLKTYTRNERIGNEGERLLEIPAGMMNSIGLTNPGIEKLDIEPFKDIRTNIIASIAVLDEDEISVFKKVLIEKNINIIELNLSCPNIKGKKIITDIIEIKELLLAVRKELGNITIFPKLSYDQVNEPNIKLLEEIGFDGLTLMNTISGMEIDIEKEQFYFENKSAGMSGRFLLPIGLRTIYDVRKWTSLPIIGCGGVWDYKDVIKYLMVGADLVEIGSSLFFDPKKPVEIIKNIREYLTKKGYKDLNDIRGILL